MFKYNPWETGNKHRRPLASTGTIVWVTLILIIGVLSQAAVGDQRAKTADVPVKSKLGSISGRITIQGESAGGLRVALQPRHRHIIEKATQTVSTDAEGRYLFSDVSSGHYWVRVLAREFVTERGFQYYGPGREVSLSNGGVVDDGDIELTRGGVLSGRVLNSEGGAVANEPVFLMLVGEDRPRIRMDLQGDEGKRFTTDAGGHYRIYGVPPGRYLVAVGVNIPRVTGTVRDPDDLTVTGRVGGDDYYAETFYPGTTEKSHARTIEVTAGSETSELDITVGKRFRAFTVSGRVVDAETGKPITNCHIELGHNVGGGYSSTKALTGPSDTDSDGRFSLRGLVPGRFYVNAHFDGQTDLYCDPVMFEVRENDVVGLEIRAKRSVSLKGTVSVEGVRLADVATKLPLLELRATESREVDRSPFTSRATSPLISPLTRVATVSDDGSFEITGLRPGKYKVSLSSSGPSEYFFLVRLENSDAANAPAMIAVDSGCWIPCGYPIERTLVGVGRASLTGLRPVLAYKNGRIRIHVDVKNGKLPHGLRLMAGIDRDGGGMLLELDSNGDLTQDGLFAGEYRVEIGDGVRRFTGQKVVKVPHNGEARVSFTVDASKIDPRN